MLSRWNPWQELAEVEREMSDLFRRAFGGGWLTPFRRERTVWTPAIDVFSRDGDLVVRAELPGIDPEKDVEIQVENDVLTLKGERRQEQRVERENYYRMETSYGAFQRSIPLPEGVNPDDIKASYENGILEVVVPKAGELAPAKKIPITVGGGRKALAEEGKK